MLGFAFGVFCFGSGIIHSVITSLITYLIVSTVKGKMGPALVFFFTMGHLSISHMIRQYEDYGGYTLDYTGPQMILVLKLTSFAFNVYDGQRSDKDLVSFGPVPLLLSLLSVSSGFSFSLAASTVAPS